MNTVVYASVGDKLTHYDLDIEAATLTPRAKLPMPSVVQYGAMHPSGRYLYVVTTDSERGSSTANGNLHRLVALRVGSDGSVQRNGEPAVLARRAIHTSVDHTGCFILTAYNAPAAVSVHRIRDDGTVGEAIPQPAGLDVGFFAHQIKTTPSNAAATLVTRGHKAGTAYPNGNPGAIKVFGFREGILTPRESIAPGENGGFGYNPRHLAFHPSKPLVYVLVEFQNELHVHRLEGDHLVPRPVFTHPLTEHESVSGVLQVGGAIHVHPEGHVLYASNRVSATTAAAGVFPFVAGENNIAVFSLDARTGEPKAIQFADPHGFHVRAFTIDPTGRILIAATLAPMRDLRAGSEDVIAAGLSLFRIAPDGRLHFERKYDVDLEPGVQQMWVKAFHPPKA